jgi:hypothetical protein
VVQHVVAPVGVGHGDEETARSFVSAGPEFGKCACDSRGLKAGKLHSQGLALGRHE